jgi:threonine dehydrogenase-like Zn-dependent dehydrogenase
VKGLTFHGKETLRYEAVPDPTIEDPGDVIVQVDLAGICGSDLHPYLEREKGLDHGTVMGHEFVGKIVEVGADVESRGGLGVGDMVFCPFTTNCGDCFYCRRGLTCRCTRGQLFGWVENGKGLHGGQADLVRVPLAGSTLMRVPDGISPEEALLMGDIFSTGFFCAEMAGAGPEGTYVVVGCGPVGLMTITAALELGAERLFAIDMIPDRLALAERFGATPIHLLNEDPVAIVKEATDGRGADGVMEVVGNQPAMRLATDLMRPGGTISSIGVHTEDTIAFTPVEAYDKNITFKSGRCPARYYMERLVPVVQEKRRDITAIISHRVPLSEGVDAYEKFNARQFGYTKVVLVP